MTGPSSNHGYFRALSTILARLADDGSTANPIALSHWQQQPLNSHGPQREAVQRPSIDLTASPDYQLAISLFNQFFATTWQVTPYLNKAKIMQQYSHAVSDQFKHTGKVKVALYNIIWAHGAYSASLDTAEMFYRRAIWSMDNLLIREADDDMGMPWMYFNAASPLTQ